MKNNLLLPLFLIGFLIVGSYYLFSVVSSTIDNGKTIDYLEYYVPNESKYWQKDILVGREVYVMPYV